MAYYRFYKRRASEEQVTNLETHPEYDEAIESWEKIRDVIQGSRFVKDRGERYLPKLHEQEKAEYEAYKERAVFFNATRRTRDGLVGLIMRKTPEIEASKEVEALHADIDMQGTTLNDYLREIGEEMTSIGRSGTLIDWSQEENRPYLCFYHAEDILSWRTQRVGGRQRLVRLVLRECDYDFDEEHGTYAPTTKVRTYKHDPETDVVTCEIEKYRDGNEVTEAEDRGEQEMKHRGKPLPAIPFVFHGLDGDRSEVPIAPLDDLAEINISHYRNSADLENGRHVAGIPTPWAAGFDDVKELVLGTNHAWVTSEKDAKAGFLEFTGQGLGALENALKEKQEQMAVLGARMLEPEKRAAEAFDTVQLRAHAEQATLVNIAEAMSATMSKALQWAAFWLGPAGKKPTDYAETDYIVLNTDFVAAKIDAPMLTALVSAYQSGAISWPTFFYNLEQGEFFKDGWSDDDEQRAVEEQPPASPIRTAPTNPEPPEPAPMPGAPPKKKAAKE